MRYLVLSDLHIGDGSAKDDFHYDDELVELLGRFDDSDTTLILNGDTLEILESECVKSLGLIPFEELSMRICPQVVDMIEENHPEVFEAVRSFSGRVIYIAGNHDYYVLVNPLLRIKVEERLGAEVVPFHYIDDLQTLVIHGNQFDVINRFSRNRKTGELVPPLGDFISRYMMIFFDEQIEALVPEQVIRDYDNVRPLLDVFNWFEHVKEVYDVGQDLVEMWVSSFLRLMRTSFARDWLRSNYPVLRFTSRIFLNKLGGVKLGEMLVRAVMGLRKVRRTDYLLRTARNLLLGRRKLSEEDFLGYDSIPLPLGKPLKGIVMGHIHHSAFRIFPSSEGYKFYINTGTWRPVVERIKGKGKAFQKKAELSYALVSVVDEKVDVVVNSTVKLEEVSPRESLGYARQSVNG